MPEEINRIVTDHLADSLFTPSPDANDNLTREDRGSPSVARGFEGSTLRCACPFANLHAPERI